MTPDPRATARPAPRAITRRSALALGSAAALSACANGVGSSGAAVIDGQVSRSLGFLEGSYPAARELAEKSAGRLVMPLVTEAGLGLGGSYGRGALLIDRATVDYYSATQATLGLQLGAQQYAHVLFFLTDDALREFRLSPGWAAGADLEYAWIDHGQSAGADTITTKHPVIATVFAQSGVLAGATVEGTKYSRIIP